LSTLRNQLLIALLLVVLIPTVAFGLISGLVGLRRGRQQVTDKLTSVAVLKEDELVAWASNVQTDLVTATIGDEVTSSMRALLSPSTTEADYEAAYRQLHRHFGAFVEETERFDELLLLDLKRRVVLSTDRQQEGGPGNMATQAYYDRDLEGEYLHPPSYTLATLTGTGVGIDVVRPVFDAEGQVLGIVAGRTGPTRLSQIMLERTGLGTTGETYLVAANYVMLTEPRFPVTDVLDAYYVFSDGAKAALDDHVNGAGVYLNHRGVRVVGAYRWVPTLEVALLAEQAEREAMAAVYETFAINVGVAVVAVLMATVVSAYLARSISVPVSNLAQTAVRVSNGEFDLAVPVVRGDEIGALAQAFNSMTARLRDLIGDLEQRVAERTRALHRRALQLETSIQVSREITSILDIDELLNRVVTLIARTFGYYHVGIYLADRETNRLIFRAGGGEVDRPQGGQSGPLELALGPGSLNGEAAQRNEIVALNDVQGDPRFRADRMLPETRSELVVPLRVGGQVIGTLDVQSKESDTFGEDDIHIMQGLSDQVAVAIDNARLYARSRALALVEERNRLARDLHDSVTQSLYGLVAFAGAGRDLIAEGESEPVECYLARMEETAQQALNEMRLLLYELRPPTLEEEGLVAALRERLDAVEARVGVETYLEADETISLPEGVAEAFYRITQEALNNALKHSSATSVRVGLRRNGAWVELSVVDDGVGFDVETASEAGGIGILGMQERAREMDGSLTIHSTPGQGTTLTLLVGRTRIEQGAGSP
jgi:nitrate/nitrite-specific signal transduction histidine kinase